MLAGPDVEGAGKFGQVALAPADDLDADQPVFEQRSFHLGLALDVGLGEAPGGRN
jgi:hypothetical protein